MKRTQSETYCRRILPIGSLLFLFAVPLMFANRQGGAHGTAQKMSVRISTAKSKIRLGEHLNLRVEICNEGSESVFVATTFDGPDNTLARLKISLFRDGSPVNGTKERSAGDYGRYAPHDQRRVPLVRELPKYWVALAPGHFYGGDFVVEPSALNTPGKYVVRGTYTSASFLTEGVNNPLAAYVEELSHMPYQPWAGEVETNPISIEVVQPARRGQAGAKH